MKLMLIPLSIAVVSCAPMPKYPIPSEFQVQVEKFQEYVGYKFDDIEYKFFDTKTNQIGICNITGSYKVVSIDSYYWKYSSDLGKEQLMFHELGHCVLKRQHNEQIIDNHPISIMYHMILPDRLYNKYYDLYIEELFK